MSTSFRNPYTPAENEALTPQQYLQRTLDFSTWNHENPVVHQISCMDDAHHQVMVNGMCCIQHLQQCVEGNLFDLAGCKAGVFVEPDGFQKWLLLAKKRLEELCKDQDDLIKWTSLLDTESDDLYRWIWEHGDDYNRNLRPGFSLNSFVVACQKYDFNPEFKDIALAFGYTESEVEDCWTKPTK